MSLAVAEQRSYPRINAKHPISIPGESQGTTINLSETGLQFELKRSFPSLVLPVTISFPSCTLEINTQVVWSTNTPSRKRFVHGAHFLNMSKKGRETLREILFFNQIEGLLAEIKDPLLHHEILAFFTEDLKKYVGLIEEFSSHITDSGIFNLEHEHRLAKMTNELLLRANTIDEALHKQNKSVAAKQLKAHFRHLISTWIYKSKLLQKASKNPLTNAGHYETLEAIYEKAPISKGIGAYFDHYFLNAPDSIALRHRKEAWKEHLMETIQQHTAKVVNILSIGCNSCCEIIELLPLVPHGRSVNFTCVDSDTGALQKARDNITHLPLAASFYFLHGNIHELKKSRPLLRSLGKQHLIYFPDLMDHLPNRLFKNLIILLAKALPAKGTMIFAHRNKDKTFPALLLDWLCDWKAVRRTPQDITRLLDECKLPNCTVETSSCDFGYMYYFVIQKH